MKRSSVNPNFWGCPFCDWPLEPDDIDIQNGGLECACGAWVELPDPPIPEKKGNKNEL
jgi:hypothetical protein